MPQNRYKKKRSYTKPRLGNNKPHGHDQYHSQILQRNKVDHKPATSNRLAPSNNFNRCLKCGDTAHCEGFTCPAKNISARHVTNLDILQANVSKKDSNHSTNLDDPKHIK